MNKSRQVRCALVAALLAAALMASVSPAEAPSGAGTGPDKPVAEAAAGNPWSDNDKAMALLKGYLDRMKIEYRAGMSGKDPMISFPVKMTNATHRVRVIVDGKKNLVYIFLSKYLVSKPGSDQQPAVLKRLMSENWKLNIGKFEWNEKDGEVRYSYCFTTENGIGYEAFTAIVQTLTQTGDRLWPELKALAAEE